MANTYVTGKKLGKITYFTGQEHNETIDKTLVNIARGTLLPSYSREDRKVVMDLIDGKRLKKKELKDSKEWEDTTYTARAVINGQMEEILDGTYAGNRTYKQKLVNIEVFVHANAPRVFVDKENNSKTIKISKKDLTETIFQLEYSKRHGPLRQAIRRDVECAYLFDHATDALRTYREEQYPEVKQDTDEKEDYSYLEDVVNGKTPEHLRTPGVKNRLQYINLVLETHFSEVGRTETLGHDTRDTLMYVSQRLKDRKAIVKSAKKNKEVRKLVKEISERIHSLL